MAVSTKRKNRLKSKSNSKTKKQFKKFRKTKKNIRKMKGGELEISKKFIGHTDIVNSVSFSPDGQYICSGSDDNTVRLWNVNTGENILILEGHTDPVLSVSFSPVLDKKSIYKNLICSGSIDNTVRLWNVETGKRIHILKGHTDLVKSVKFSPNGELICSGSGDNTVRLWDVKTGKIFRTLQGHRNEVNSVTFSFNGQLIFSGSGDKTIREWGVFDSGSPSQEMFSYNAPVTSMAHSFDGSNALICSASEDSTVRLRIGDDKTIYTLEGHESYINSVSFSPDGQYICSGSDDSTVRVWNVGTKGSIHTLEGHNNEVNSVSYSPDGNYICSGSTDKTLRLWNIKKIEEEKEKEKKKEERREILEEYFTNEKNKEVLTTNSVHLGQIIEPYIASDGNTYDIDTAKASYDNFVKSPAHIIKSPITNLPLKVIDDSKDNFEKYFVKNRMLSNIFEHIIKERTKNKDKIILISKLEKENDKFFIASDGTFYSKDEAEQKSKTDEPQSHTGKLLKKIDENATTKCKKYFVKNIMLEKVFDYIKNEESKYVSNNYNENGKFVMVNWSKQDQDIANTQNTKTHKPACKKNNGFCSILGGSKKK